MSKVDETTERVAAWIVDALEQSDGLTWSAPWHNRRGLVDVICPHNAETGKAYRGFNVLAFASEALERGYSSGTWATYKQWQALGAQVRRGEHGTYGVKWVVKQNETDEEGRVRQFPAGFAVFNADQVDGWERPSAPVQDWDDVGHVEAFFAAIGADVRHGGNRAYYSQAGDFVAIPDRGQFDTEHGYYGTLAHEHVHWTGAKHRLDRTFGKRFADQAYALEELVAELGAATLCARLGLATDPRADHVSYLGHWIKVLRESPRVLLTVCARVSDAVDHLEKLTARAEAAA